MDSDAKHWRGPIISSQNQNQFQYWDLERVTEPSRAERETWFRLSSETGGRTTRASEDKTRLQGKRIRTELRGHFFSRKSGETMEWVTKGGERSKKQPDLQKKIKKSHRESRPREIESRAEEKCQMRGHCTITIYHLQETRGLTDDHRTRTRTRAGFNS